MTVSKRKKAMQEAEKAAAATSASGNLDIDWDEGKTSKVLSNKIRYVQTIKAPCVKPCFQ